MKEITFHFTKIIIIGFKYIKQPISRKNIILSTMNGIFTCGILTHKKRFDAICLHGQALYYIKSNNAFIYWRCYTLLYPLKSEINNYFRLIALITDKSKHSSLNHESALSAGHVFRPVRSLQ